jgi:hypothetical protein
MRAWTKHAERDSMVIVISRAAASAREESRVDHSGTQAPRSTLLADTPLPLTFTGLHTVPFGHCELN